MGREVYDIALGGVLGGIDVLEKEDILCGS